MAQSKRSEPALVENPDYSLLRWLRATIPAMRLRLEQAELQEAVRRTWNKTHDPSSDDLIKLYLFLPVEIEIQRQTVQVKSALEALLTDAHRVTGRDDDGNVLNEEHLGTWLGVMGYLALVDQIGKVLKWTSRPDCSGAKFEQILQQHGKTEAEAAALYGFRNAMVHSYGLANENRDKPKRQHYFRLNVWGGSPLVDFPRRPWDGDPTNVGEDVTTTVSLQAVGNLGETLVLDLQESYLNDNTSVTLRKDVLATRSGYFYFYGLPL